MEASLRSVGKPLVLVLVVFVSSASCLLSGGSGTPIPADGDADVDTDADADSDADARACEWPSFDCSPLGCVNGGYCCRWTEGVNACYSTMALAEQGVCSSALIFDCGGGDGCADGYVSVSWDGAPAVCSLVCQYDSECESGGCTLLSDGTFACAPRGSTPCSPSCASDEVCVVFPDGSASCGDTCFADGDCASGCCAELDSGDRACVPSSYCGTSCTPSCGGRACGDDDGCGGTCLAPCPSPLDSCVLYGGDEPFYYCVQLCTRDYDCCAGSAPGAVRDGAWCCLPGSLTPSGYDVCGWSADYTCRHFSEDPCGG